MFGLILVILGILFLLEEMGIIAGSFWGYFWPIILIVVGISIMRKDRNFDCGTFFGVKKSKTEQHKVVDEQ